MKDDNGLDLVAVCAGVAGELDGVSSTVEGDTLIYRRSGAEFARVTRSSLEVRLPAEIGEAAQRTPDTTRSSERGWIRFAPRSAERHVTDRAAAWFQTAWRHAAGTT